MKKLFMYSALLLACCLAGCSNEIGKADYDPNYIEPGSALMHIKVGFPSPKGYAVGDSDPTVATAAEKEIHSIAFFVKTSHTFGKYFSEETPLTPNGFTEPLTKVVDGQYTASFKVRSAKMDGTTTCEIIAIANYAESNLDFSNVGTMKQLKQMLTEPLDGTSNLGSALLMYGEENTLRLKDAEAFDLAIEMERMVARVDVVNQAGTGAGDGSNDFLLTSARLLNVPSQSALFPLQAQTYAAVDMTPSYGLVTPTDKSINSIYLYETLNDNPTNQPRIEIKGTYKGAPVLKEISFKLADEVDNPGTFFPIKRNYHYVINILPGNDEQDVVFNVIAKDWDEGVNIEVKPDKVAPALEDFVFAADPADATWDAATTTLTLLQTLAGEVKLSFKASAFQAPVMGGFVLVKDDTDSKIFADAAWVASGEVIGYADPMPLSRVFTLTIPTGTDFGALITTAGGAEGEHVNLWNIQSASAAYATPITIKYTVPAVVNP